MKGQLKFWYINIKYDKLVTHNTTSNFFIGTPGNLIII